MYPELYELNPNGKVTCHLRIIILRIFKVPVVQHEGKVVYESLVVSEYLDDTYENKGTKLLPRDPFQRVTLTSRIFLEIYNEFLGSSKHLDFSY